jgi:hypothetical protein
LNSTYKLASSCIAERIKSVLSHIISNDQTGVIPGRYTGENCRLIYDILHFTDICDKTDFILSAIQLEANLYVEFKRVIGRQFFKNYFDLPSFWDTSNHSLSLCDRHVSLLISMINRSEDKFAHINPEKF